MQPQPMQPQPIQPQPMQPQPMQPQPQQIIVTGQPGSTTIYTGQGGQQVIVQGGMPSQEWVRPDKLAYEPGEVIPQGYVDRELQNIGLLVAGASTFAGIYLPTLIAGLTLADNDVGFAALSAPVIGPLIGIGTIRGVEGVGAYFLVLDFLAQTSGVVMFAASFASHPHVLRRVGETEPAGTVHVGVRPGGASLSLSF